MATPNRRPPRVSKPSALAIAAEASAELENESHESVPAAAARPRYTDKLGPVPEDDPAPLEQHPASQAPLQAPREGARVAMKWTGERLAALVKALRHHHVWDPDMHKHGDMQKVYATILEEEPWRSISGLAGWRPLYNKGLEVVKEYAVAIEREKMHTGGGRPSRPDWWKNCEKELDVLARWRVTAAVKREEVSTQQAEEEEKKQLTDTVLAERALRGLGKRPAEQGADIESSSDLAAQATPRALSRKALRDDAIGAIKTLLIPPSSNAEELQLRKDELVLRREELALARTRAENEYDLRKEEYDLRKEELKGQQEAMKLQHELVLRLLVLRLLSKQ